MTILLTIFLQTITNNHPIYDYTTDDHPTIIHLIHDYLTNDLPTKDHPTDDHPTEQPHMDDHLSDHLPTSDYFTGDHPTNDYITDTFQLMITLVRDDHSIDD